MPSKDSSEIRVGDENTPSAQLPDAELISAIKRVYKHDDVKKCLYNALAQMSNDEIESVVERICKNSDVKKHLHTAVKVYEKEVKRDWVPTMIHGGITLLGIATTAVIIMVFK